MRLIEGENKQTNKQKRFGHLYHVWCIRSILQFYFDYEKYFSYILSLHHVKLRLLYYYIHILYYRNTKGIQNIHNFC